ncbi:YrbL family protein [Neorhizobium alkalisoli]|uniref:YrbL family protein n=1 Tax=Neorhizobium alkalisoli TaxID=528178 RepID=UPI00131A3EFA|nr:YrbL family protein [Neorhizobium alkalisoli]
MFASSLDLADGWSKIAEGSARDVYASADYPDVLLKLVKPECIGVNGSRKTRHKLLFFRKYRRFGAYMTFRREFDEYLEQARKSAQWNSEDLPIAKVFGLVHTSLGLGLVVEKVRDRNGQLAPTLLSLARSGKLTQRHYDMLAEFFEECRKRHIVLMDKTPGNFVVAPKADGGEHIVCIDGTGDKSLFKLYSASRYFNGLKLERYHRKVLWKMAKAMQSKPQPERLDPRPDAIKLAG